MVKTDIGEVYLTMPCAETAWAAQPRPGQLLKPSMESQYMSEPNRELSVVNANAAGIDLGADYHWVSVPEGHDSECIRRFGCFSADLYAIAD